uniref:Uncharacterized protein n=1 Tax=Arundo donax TaxID=35708 RepID=A0A0A8ZZD0_ARUDO
MYRHIANHSCSCPQKVASFTHIQSFISWYCVVSCYQSRRALLDVPARRPPRNAIAIAVNAVKPFPPRLPRKREQTPAFPCFTHPPPRSNTTQPNPSTASSP